MGNLAIIGQTLAGAGSGETVLETALGLFTSGNTPSLLATIPSPHETWDGVNNILADNDLVNTVAINNNQRTDNGVDLYELVNKPPAGATIKGIEITLRRSAVYGGPANVLDEKLQLIKAGALAGNDKSSPSYWNSTLGNVTYGGPTDLWGTTWSAAEVRAANFGICIQAIEDSAIFSSHSIAWVKAKIYYTP